MNSGLLKPQLRNSLVGFVLSAIMLLNVAVLGAILYLYRFSIYCGVGVGTHAVVAYVPSLVLVVASYFFLKASTALHTLRNGLVIGNVAFLALLAIQGICFSCVDTCVEGLLAR